MKKVIKIEMNFPDGFIPPEKFDDPRANPYWESKCDLCPFFEWNDEDAYGSCIVSGEKVCPIKKYFG